MYSLLWLKESLLVTPIIELWDSDTLSGMVSSSRAIWILRTSVDVLSLWETYFGVIAWLIT